MKDKENQMFGGYGNHDFPTEIKQERPNNITSQSEKIVYGSLITSTKCYNCIHFPLCFAQKGGANLELASENDCCYYQSKLPENSVVLSREEVCELKCQAEEDFNKAYDLGSKETAEKILKDFKLWAREYQNKDTVVDENGERLMTNNEKLNYLYTYLCDKYKVEIKD